ncbi:uncharacterized protein N7483_009907 [Penicillium malachiteum]|uniref:uncharacterized protein n=1 Tax=Penicillium malachiteum TaxID=1324776 RepID=UPI0025498911|nr:uncharacterized protein N7483_009907 [Penicillium malachiteum]KAJ5718825.1 hypothetical protein N7483_009907 [Penicillium malachiteum]
MTIAVGVQDGPSTAPDGWVSDYKIVNSPSFADGVSAISTLIFACSATPGYFSIPAEMRDPRYFTRAAVISQFISTLIYLAIGIVVYYYCGSMVASPALGPAGHLIKRISYGVALPGLLASTTIFLHYPSNGIPIFGDLVFLIGALLGFLLAYQPAGCMWLYDNSKSHERNWKWVTLACWSVFIIVVGSFMTVAGTYGSIVSIIDALSSGQGTKPWTCADNSNS